MTERCRCWDDPNPPPGARCKLCGRIAPGEPPHRCHARGCPVPVKPEMLMCRKHWFMVPYPIRRAVWAEYRPGQCDDRVLSKEWLNAAGAAIGYVAFCESKGITLNEAEALRGFGYAEIADSVGRPG